MEPPMERGRESAVWADRAPCTSAMPFDAAKLGIIIINVGGGGVPISDSRL